MTFHLWDMNWAAILGTIMGSALDPISSIPAIILGWYFKNNPLAVLLGAVLVALISIAVVVGMTRAADFRMVFVEAKVLAAIILAFAAFGVRKLFLSHENKKEQNVE